MLRRLWWEVSRKASRNPPRPQMCRRRLHEECRGKEEEQHEGLREPVAVAMSGGVDSSVAALLLKEQGYKIFGVHMRNWDEEEEKGEHRGPGVCTSAQDLQDAKNTCRHLDIPLREVSFSKEYWTRVFEPTLEGYIDGVTPNPDVMCNREIKFDPLMAAVLGMDARTLATGHYARLSHNPTRLLRAADEDKDQTYFLSSVPSSKLAKAAFPLGGLRKGQVREIAIKAGLPAAQKRESMGLCFVGKRNFRDFISEYVPPMNPGRFVNTDGEDMGESRAPYLYTEGQGAKIGGLQGKWFVVSKDVKAGKVVIAEGTDNTSLFSRVFEAGPPAWVAGVPPPFPLACQIRVRHRQELIEAVIVPGERQTIRVESGIPIRAIARGQVVAIYSGDECLGSAPITRSEHQGYH